MSLRKSILNDALRAAANGKVEKTSAGIFIHGANVFIGGSFAGAYAPPDDDFGPWTVGENLVIEGVDSRSVCVGDRFETESVLLEVTSTRIPCNTLTARLGDPGFARRFMQAGRPGFYCRVLRDGVIQTGDTVTYTPFDGDPVTMPELLRTYGKNLSEEDRIRYLAAPINDKLRAALTG